MKMNHAIIGCGRVAPCHVDGLRHCGEDVLACADIDPRRAQSFASDFQVGIVLPDFASVLADSRIGSLSLCVPHHLHASMALDALRAGKHVLIEKPVILDLSAEARIEQAAAAQPGLIAMPVAQHRFDPIVIEIGRLLRSGGLGEIRMIRAHLECVRPPEYYCDSGWRGRWSTEGGSVLINQAYHMLDLMLVLGGSVGRIKADMTTFAPAAVMETEDTLTAVLRYDSGALGNLTVTGASGSQWGSYIELLCSEGEVAFTINSPPAMPRFRMNNKEAFVEWRPRLVGALKLTPAPSLVGGYYGASHREQIRAFIGAIQGTPHPAAATFAQAVTTIRTVQEIYRAAAPAPTHTGPAPVVKTAIWDEQWSDVRAEDVEGVAGLIRRGEISIASGGLLGRFEKRFAAFAGVSEAVAFCNGTGALYAALWALGVRAGDEVLLSDYAYHGTAAAILALGATIVVCDCLPGTLCLDPAEIGRRRTPRTKAIMVHNPWGVPAQFDEIRQQAGDIPLVSDASHAHGAWFGGRPIAAWADITCFSLGKHKLISGGELGCAVTASAELRDRMLVLSHVNRVPGALRTLGWKGNAVGLKMRPHPLAMSLALSQMSRFDEKSCSSRASCGRIERLFAEFDLNAQQTPDGSLRSYWKLVFHLGPDFQGRDALPVEKALRAHGFPLEANHYWPLLQHSDIAQWSDHAGRVRGADTPCAHDAAPRTITLPGAVDLTEESYAKMRAALAGAMNSDEVKAMRGAALAASSN